MKDFEGKFSWQFSVHSQPYYELYGKDTQAELEFDNFALRYSKSRFWVRDLRSWVSQGRVFFTRIRLWGMCLEMMERKKSLHRDQKEFTSSEWRMVEGNLWRSSWMEAWSPAVYLQNIRRIFLAGAWDHAKILTRSCDQKNQEEVYTVQQEWSRWGSERLTWSIREEWPPEARVGSLITWLKLNLEANSSKNWEVWVGPLVDRRLTLKSPSRIADFRSVGESPQEQNPVEKGSLHQNRDDSRGRAVEIFA